MAKEEPKPAPAAPAPAAPEKPAEKKEKKAKPAKKEKGGPKPYRKGRNCPKCGSGVRLAEHVNRFSCGRCGYMEKK